MECSLLALISCFSWTNFYVDAGLSYQDAGYYVQQSSHDSVRVERDGVVISEGAYDSRGLRGERKNPYGRIALGWDLQLSRAVSARLDVFHVSSTTDGNDRGVNGAVLSVRWYPFR